MVKREEIFVTTKLWNTSHKPELVEKELDESLKQLGLDYVDLYRTCPLYCNTQIVLRAGIAFARLPMPCPNHVAQ